MAVHGRVNTKPVRMVVALRASVRLDAWWHPLSAASPLARRSSSSFTAASGSRHSCHESLTITTGARSQAPRHSTSTSVNVPVGSVSPGRMPSFPHSSSVTRSAPLNAHDSVRQTLNTNFPTGLV